MQKVFTLTGNLLAETTAVFKMPSEGGTSRAEGNSEFKVGGKGVNVARTAAALGFKVFAAVFPAGFSGKRCLAELAKEKFFVISAEIEGETRIGLVCENIETKTRTTFLGADVPVKEAALCQVLEKISAEAEEGDALALSGSFAGWMPSFAEKIAALCEKKRLIFCADTYGPPLRDILNVKCALLKINRAELFGLLGETDGGTLEDFKDAFARGGKLAAKAKVFACTDGANAALFSAGGKLFEEIPPKVGKPIDATGCGDAALAVLICELFGRGTCLRVAASRAMRYASMCAATPETGVLSPEKATEALK